MKTCSRESCRTFDDNKCQNGTDVELCTFALLGKQVAEEKKAEKIVNGDVYDEDTGEHLGSIDPLVSALTQNFTMELAVYHNGRWYVFKLDRSYEDDNPNA